ALAIFVLGGLTGVMVALAPFDFQAHDTYFIVAHLHYVLIGGMLFPVIAGLYYFFPLARNKTLSDRLGRIAFWLMFIGFNIAFLPMHFTGLLGMPRRVYTYGPDMGFDMLNMVSTVGAFILAAGVAVLVWDVLRPKGKQPYSARNPWNAGTLEWLAEMPGRAWGARSIPIIKSRYPLWDQPNLMRDVDAGRFYLPDAEEGKRETLISSIIDAEPIQCLRVPGPTFLSMWAAIFTGGLFIFATYSWYVAALVSGGLALITILIWLWTGTAVIPEKPKKDIG
ncbi:MAG TPA: cytochrome ubiquinol oxidase subunit I, partial [Pseudomonas sp.]|nr:cytochrome ubiquinol oxidase subunit I [Pseudomonas sp.]